MGNPNSKSSFKNNNLSKQINFMGNTSQNHSKYSGIKSGDRDNDVLTKFTWNYGGNSVFLTGSFNNWKKNIPMERQGDQFCVTLLLPRQVHQYKFIVDGQWRFSPQDATMSDDNGYINNYIDTTNFQPLIPGNNKNNQIDDQSGPLYPKHSKQHSKQKTKNDKKQQYAKYAPKLPPHYEYCLFLGKKKNQEINGVGSISSNTSLFGNHSQGQGQVQQMGNIIGMGDQDQYNSSHYQSNMEDHDNINRSILHNSSPMKFGQGQNFQATLTQQQIQYLFKTPHSLPMPTHITLDHIMTQQGDWYSAMAVTQRFKQKYSTFTYFSIDRTGGSQKQVPSMEDHNYYQGNKNLYHHKSSMF